MKTRHFVLLKDMPLLSAGEIFMTTVDGSTMFPSLSDEDHIYSSKQPYKLPMENFEEYKDWFEEITIEGEWMTIDEINLYYDLFDKYNNLRIFNHVPSHQQYLFLYPSKMTSFNNIPMPLGENNLDNEELS